MKKINFLQFKLFKKHKNLVHGVFFKKNGNIDFRFGEKKQVLENRKIICKTFGFEIRNLYEMDQVHGSNIEVLTKKNKKKFRKNIVPKTDGIITNEKNLFFMIKTADCFPVLLYDSEKKVISAIHIGWRGAIEKIFLNTLLKMISFYKTKVEDVLVAICPGIGPCCFKHKKLIQEKLPEWQKYIKNGKNNIKSLDISVFIKDQLIEAGINKKNIEDCNICTSCSNQFYSHFKSLRKKQTEGRFATIIGIR